MWAIHAVRILLCLAPLPVFAEGLGDQPAIVVQRLQARQGHEYKSNSAAYRDIVAKIADSPGKTSGVTVEEKAAAAIRIERSSSSPPVVDAAGGSASPIKPYYDFVYYTSVGNLERALAEFADDAVVVASPSCPVGSPCRGKAAIKDRYILPMIQRRASLPLPERYEGNRISARSDSPAGPTSARQFFRFRDGLIASVLTEEVSHAEWAATPRQPSQGTDAAASCTDLHLADATNHSRLCPRTAGVGMSFERDAGWCSTTSACLRTDAPSNATSQ